MCTDNISCEKCDFECTDAEVLQKHLDSKHENRISDQEIDKLDGKIMTEFFCTDCNFITNNGDDLEEHKQVHSPVMDASFITPKYHCGKCAYSSESKDELNVHIDKEHKVDLKFDASVTSDSIGSQFKCKKCGNMFNNDENLETHMKEKHIVMNIYHCTSCEYRTTVHRNLKMHVKASHTTEQNNQNIESDLTASEEVKSNVVICGECASVFQDMQTCEDHIECQHRTTPTFEPVTCEGCNLVLATPILMKEHKDKYHDASNMVPCKDCELLFQNAASLETHMSEVHDFKTYGCKQCSYESNMYIEILRHTFQYHDVGKGHNKEFSPSDIILEFLTVQNTDVMGEMRQAFEQLSNGLKFAFEQLSNGMQDNFDKLDTKTTSAYSDIQKSSEKMKKLEEAVDKLSKQKKDDSTEESRRASAPQPTVQQPPSSSTQPSSKTKYLQKPRILYVGDSVAQNIDPSIIERETGSRLTTAKAYSSIEDNRSKWPRKNAQEVTNKHLDEVFNKDEFEHLVLGAPTVDITNLDTTRTKAGDSVEYFKQQVAVSCQNMFTTAQNALVKYPKLKTVTIMEHPPRFDNVDKDQSFLKPKLANYANDVFRQLWSGSSLKHKIVLGLSQGLECKGKARLARYTRTHDNKHDGIHLYGVSGRLAFRRSVSAIINSVLSPAPASVPVTPQSGPAQGAATTGGQDRYNVKTNNFFDILGN